jgi:hypothetical protein
MGAKRKAKTKKPSDVIDSVRQAHGSKSSMRNPIVMHLSYPSQARCGPRQRRSPSGVRGCETGPWNGERFWASSVSALDVKRWPSRL